MSTVTKTSVTKTSVTKTSVTKTSELLSEIASVHALAYRELRRRGLPDGVACMAMERVARPMVVLAWMEMIGGRPGPHMIPARVAKWIGASDRTWSHLWHGPQRGPLRLCSDGGAGDPEDVRMARYSVRELS